MKNYIYAYKNGSASAKALGAALGLKLLKHEGKPKEVQTLINWGSSRDPERAIISRLWVNIPEGVARALNKLTTFRWLQGEVPIPMFTTEPGEAIRWLYQGESPFIVCRTLLEAHSGKGIVLADDPKNVPDAPLYTAYVPKKDEYRLHVFQGEVFFVQRKARKLDVLDENVNWKIRNHANGFIYSHKEVEATELMKEIAVKAIQTLELDFGAVDLITTYKGENPIVLEINTAPGLEGTTLEKYVEQFRKVL